MVHACVNKFYNLFGIFFYNIDKSICNIKPVKRSLTQILFLKKSEVSIRVSKQKPAMVEELSQKCQKS